MSLAEMIVAWHFEVSGLMSLFPQHRKEPGATDFC